MLKPGRLSIGCLRTGNCSKADDLNLHTLKSSRNTRIVARAVEIRNVEKLYCLNLQWSNV